MKKSYLFFIILIIPFWYTIQAQITVASQGFDGAGTWGYTTSHTNGNSFITGAESYLTPSSLQLENYWNDNSAITFNTIDISSFTGVQFSIAYQSIGESDNNDDLYVDYYYYDGGAWVTISIKIIDGGTNPNSVSFGTAGNTGQTNPFVVSIPDSATDFYVIVRGTYNNDSGGDHDTYFIDDLILTATPSPNPTCSDDILEVLIDSTSGIANQIDVSTNDNIGTDGSAGLGDDYAINTTATNGTVIEIIDGVFEYIPNINFIGTDSFTYNLCDAGGDCASATVNVTIGYNYCNPNSDSTDGSSRNLHITNVFLDGEGTADINNGSGDNGGYADFTTSVAAPEVLIGNTYPITIDADSNPNWVKGQVLWSVYIDFNQDGDFDDAGEILYQSTGQENNPPYDTQNISIPAAATPGLTVMRIGLQAWNVPNACASNTGSPSEYEDYLINIQELDVPTALDDSLIVIVDSTSGIDNQIDVSINDNIGSDGGDLNNYTLTSATSTANGGTITEVTDGVFEYVPAPGFIGTDSFTYELCDAGMPEDCATAIVSVIIRLDTCIPPVDNHPDDFYINNFYLEGDSGNLNNPSSLNDDIDGYSDYTIEGLSTIPEITLGTEYDFIISLLNTHAWGKDSGYAIWIDLNGDNDFDDASELVVDSASGLFPHNTNPNGSFTLNSGTAGVTVMRVMARTYGTPYDPCRLALTPAEDNGGEVEDYFIEILPAPTAEITVVSGSAEIFDGDTTTSILNNTDFGVYAVGAEKFKSYTIINHGVTPLTVSSAAITGGDTAQFRIATQPSTMPLATGESTTFVIGFFPDTDTTYNANVRIVNDDSDEDLFDFVVEGNGGFFPDTDGDNVPDIIDLDDDNDGIEDSVEQANCVLSSGSTTEIEFIRENFAAGISRATVYDNIPGVSTTYCYEDGTVGTNTGLCQFLNNTSLNDGEYTVHYSVTSGANVGVTPTGTEVAVWAYNRWANIEDHTPGDTNGRMLIINADNEPGIFYENLITGVIPNVTTNYNFWAINIDAPDYVFSAGELDANGNRILPNITVNFLSSDYSVTYATFNTGDITRCDGDVYTLPNGSTYNQCAVSDWKEFTSSFIPTDSEFIVQFINNTVGGLGNDLAIDDIVISQVLCDSDGDGVSDVIDLDNDDDGIPNVVELGLPDLDKDATLLGTSWSDTNNNGLHDSYESGITPVDTDGDGTPDYLDADSDNDGIFDTVEYDGQGDIDIDGDGLGDGSDEQVLDVSNMPIGNDDFDGDGILSIIDGNDDDADNNDHGSSGYLTPLDSDGDGTPDYQDVDSNDALDDPSNGTDISETIYAYLDTDNDGEIDGTTDIDDDGVLDVFDSDTMVFGSPRVLDDSYTLFFDGRNDYVEDSNVLASGSATIMGWIRSEGVNTSSTNRIALGQDEFYIQVNHSDNTVSLVLNGSAVLTSTTAVTDGIWIHVTATTSASETVLYINGENEGSITSGGVSADASSFTIGRLADTDSQYFHGEIDEVRVFNAALTEDELQKMVYQELDETNSFNSGKIVPLDINATVGGGLQRYYKMDVFSSDITEDKTTSSTTAKLYNIKDIYFQTAPLPYETIADGDWGMEATWLYGDVWDITDEANNKDWSIVHVKHDLTTSNRHGTVGLLVDSGVELEVNNNVELQNSWYLNLGGLIDLQGESQLVQTQNSILEATGDLERDQQGTENLYTYNYWSSPVHSTNPNAAIDGDETYTVESILLNGADPNNLEPITFVGGGNYDGDSTTSPIEIADYWIWKFDNRTAEDYSEWQHLRSTGDLLVGEGYTMKGPGTGTVATDRNYAFIGTPNNGEINLFVDSGNAYLVGNPYPSAIDGAEFLSDNTHLNGTLYFWEHYGGGSHILKQYQGGYGLYNYSGGTPPLNGSLATSDPDVDQTGGGTKIPKQYIPVGQGFFVEATSDGDIKFENDQRIFVTESGGTNSIFFKNANTKKSKSTNLEDLRPKIRIGYTSPKGYKRQLLVTADEKASMDYDWGYEGALIEENVEDMYWKIENENYIIQGINNIDPSITVLPFGVKTQEEGIVEIAIDSLENVADNLEVYIRDKDNDLYYNLRESKYLVNIPVGSVDDRFEIVFSNQEQLSNTELEFDKQTSLYYDNSNSNLVIVNPKNYQINELQLINTLGQIITTSKVGKSDNLIEIYTNLKTGIYIVRISASEFKIAKTIIINN